MAERKTKPKIRSCIHLKPFVKSYNKSCKIELICKKNNNKKSTNKLLIKSLVIIRKGFVLEVRQMVSDLLHLNSFCKMKPSYLHNI